MCWVVVGSESKCYSLNPERLAGILLYSYILCIYMRLFSALILPFDSIRFLVGWTGDRGFQVIVVVGVGVGVGESWIVGSGNFSHFLSSLVWLADNDAMKDTATASRRAGITLSLGVSTIHDRLISRALFRFLKLCNHRKIAGYLSISVYVLRNH